MVNASPESTADPSGSVQFYVDGTAYGDPVPLDADGAASTTDEALPAGTHEITAGFLPDDDDFVQASPRPLRWQEVDPADTTTTIDWTDPHPPGPDGHLRRSSTPRTTARPTPPERCNSMSTARRSAPRSGSAPTARP